VGLVAGGALNLDNAIPIVMGANIGTTITNTLVSMGYITRRVEFRRAFSASIVHDYFNICAVIVFFPIEINYHIIAKSAHHMEKIFAGAGGMNVFNPLKLIIDPVLNIIDRLFAFLPYANIFLLVASIVLLFLSLTLLIKTIRVLMLNKIETIINKYLFRNDFLGFTLAIMLTFVVQSSSVTTSIIVPLAGAGLITIRQIYPYTLGANIGTTGTAIIAALATQNEIAVTVAFAHLIFNILGILVFYPLNFIPIKAAEWVGEMASKSTKNLITFVILYILAHFIPIVILIFS
jgi:sodium-dependent phosphate cotransporter